LTGGGRGGTPSRAVGLAVAAQGATATLLAGLALVNGVSGGERLTTFLCAALALSFGLGVVMLWRLPRVEAGASAGTSAFADHLNTWVPVVGMFVAGYLLSGVGVALFVAVGGGGAWLLGRSAGKRLSR
jgi:hypothetical protein